MGREECIESASPLRWGRRRFAGGVWLIFLGFPLASLLGDKVSTLHLVLVLVGFVACLAGYCALLYENRLSSRRSIARGIVFGLMVLSLLMAAFDRGGWATVIVYATAAMAILRLFSERVAITLVLGFSAAATLLLLATGESVDTAITVGVTCGGVGMLLIGFAEMRAHNVELVRARDERAKLAVAEERLRFARDMHDLLGHSLSVIALKAELAGRLLKEDAAAAAIHVGDVEAVARGALAEVRDAVSGYRKPDLAAELQSARTALSAAGIEARIEGIDGRLAREVEALLAWTVREGTTNVIRHSGARRCTVRIDADRGLAHVDVTDDGCSTCASGRDETPLADGARSLAAEGHGLTGLRERVERVAGVLHAGPRPEGGFHLSVSVPLPASDTAGGPVIDAAGGASHVAGGASHVADGASHVADGASHVADGASHVADGASHVAGGPDSEQAGALASQPTDIPLSSAHAP